MNTKELAELLDGSPYPLRITRELNVLRAEGYTHLEQLTALTDVDLMIIPNLGKKSLRNIKDVWQLEVCF